MKAPASTLSADLLQAEIERNVAVALKEDIGSGDLSALLVPAYVFAAGTVISRENGVLCGTGWFDLCFRKIDPCIKIQWIAADGDRIVADQIVCRFEGPARSLLTGERTALNFLQLLSGVAGKARQFVEAVAGIDVQIVDTRKTLPGLRIAGKYAVACGGAANHRIGLYDAIMVKENHIVAAGSITAATAAAKQVAARAEQCKFIEVEVENLDELRQALDAGADMILLDNMSLDELRSAVAINGGRAALEASGNISLGTVRRIAETGVDRISVGGLTKTVRAHDYSLRLHG